LFENCQSKRVAANNKGGMNLSLKARADTRKTSPDIKGVETNPSSKTGVADLFPSFKAEIVPGKTRGGYGKKGLRLAGRKTRSEEDGN